NPPAGIALIPGAVEGLGCGSELHDEVARQILWLGLAAFLAPQADQGGLIAAHDDPGVGAANEVAAGDVGVDHHAFAPEPELVQCTLTLRPYLYTVNSN